MEFVKAPLKPNPSMPDETIRSSQVAIFQGNLQLLRDFMSGVRPECNSVGQTNYFAQDRRPSAISRASAAFLARLAAYPYCSNTKLSRADWVAPRGLRRDVFRTRFRGESGRVYTSPAPDG
jgi:hypothetical protein